MHNFGTEPAGPDFGTGLHLRARVFRRTGGPPGGPWYVDIDDPADPQPDDPYWYGYYGSQRAAVEAACQRIAALERLLPSAIAA